MAQMTLAHARGLLGWTQTELAKRSGVRASTICRIESGELTRYSYVVVMKLIAALQDGGLKGVSAEDVFPVEAA
jgi:transcriptional regulator with XRE-family HTH domain